MEKKPVFTDLRNKLLLLSTEASISSYGKAGVPAVVAVSSL